ncbi:MAG: hypothetical protein RMK45_07505, partial [Armatimonadota bacterium]|nr:hypothetical protein [Armatimonadota bacterium]
NPQGVRWFYETPFVEQRLQQAGLSDALPELVRTSRLEMRAYHKLVLETVRRLSGTSGYIVSGLKDTPITTAGLIDERGVPKVAPESYLAFNADTVLLLDWHRRRVWLAGGDRPANPDPYNHFGGRTVYPRILASHFGAPLPVETLRWRLQTGNTVLCEGEVALRGDSARLTGRGVQFLAQLAVPLPNSDTPLRVCFQAELIAPSGEQVASNEWWWGVYPVPDWASLQGVAVHDPTDALWGLPPLQAVPLTEAQVLLTAQWNDQVRAFVEAGGNALWLLMAPVPELECLRLPFWREAAHRFLPHPLWETIPRPDYLDECLFAFSTDLACAATTFEGAPIRPVWQRVDTRTGYTHWYLGEFTLGKGKVLACTLHFAGHQGDTPLTLHYHPAGQYWLWAMLRYLASR